LNRTSTIGQLQDPNRFNQLSDHIMHYVTKITLLFTFDNVFLPLDRQFVINYTRGR